ncbi:hypothetical protein BGZ76_009824, partial [Entomortierella beljakovae]
LEHSSSALKMTGFGQEPTSSQPQTMSSLPSSAMFGEHHVSEVEPPKKAHLCPWLNCHKTFTRSAHLARHVRSHGGEKPYACVHEGCGKTFSRSDVLKEHTRIHDVNKVRKRNTRTTPGEKSKFKNIKKSAAASAAAAAAIASAAASASMSSPSVITPHRNSTQLTAIPPPLTRRATDGISMAPSEVFPSIFNSAGGSSSDGGHETSPRLMTGHFQPNNSSQPQTPFSYQPHNPSQGQEQSSLLTQGIPKSSPDSPAFALG